MSRLHVGRPRSFLLASGVLVSFATIEISKAFAQHAGAREQLPAVEVTAPPDQKRRQSKPVGRDERSGRRATAPQTGAPAAQTPLNSNAVAGSASRLGLSVREVPATVEVISAKTIREQATGRFPTLPKARSA